MKKLVLGLLFIVVTPVYAASFVNGDFSAGNASWNDASGSGLVSFSGGQAMLQTGAGVDSFSAVMVQGDDGFFNFSNPVSLEVDTNWLLFDAKFDVLGMDNSENISGFTDALFVSLYDALDFNLDLLLDPIIDSSLDGLGFLSYALDVSSLQGRDVALSFELADENDGNHSKVTLDNVQFAASLPVATVPIPSALVLFLAGLPLLGFKGKKLIK